MLFQKSKNENSEEIKQYISVNVSTKFDTIKPYIEVAEREYIKSLLGEDQYEELDDYYNNPVAPEERLDNLLKFAQRALINLAYYRGFPILIVKMSDQGAYRNENDKQKGLFKYQERNLRNMFRQDGFNGLDAMLEYLEDNIAVFPNFKTSDNYTVFKSNFINTTAQFDDIYDIGRSRIVFLKMRRFMDFIEDSKIMPLIGREFFDELKTQIKDNSLTPANKKAVALIRKATAFFSVSSGMAEIGVNLLANGIVFESSDGNSDYDNSENVKGEEMNPLVSKSRKKGELYLNYLKNMLHNNIDDYPTYKNSGVYDSTNTGNIRDNTAKKTFWT